MAFYIWLDKDGKETDRKPKGRGRSRTGAELRDDGNYYISDEPKTKVSLSIDATDSLETEPKTIKHRKSKKNPNYTEIEYDSTPNEVEVNQIKCYKEATKVHLKDFLSWCFLDPSDFTATDELIILSKVIMIKDTGLLNLKFNSAYSRIEIDIKENVTRVWSMCPKNPSFYIKDLFLDFNIE